MAPGNEPLPRLRFRWLLGDTPQQRLRLSQQLLATSLMFASALILVYSGLVAGRPLVWVLTWTFTSLGALVAVYAVIRSGWSERFADPAMTEVQMALSLISGGGAYLLAGPLRALTMPIMLLVLVFGIFGLTPGRALRMGLFGFACLAAAVLLGLGLGLGHPLHEDIGHLMMALVVFPGVSILSGRISRIRHRLREQREALNEAVARIERLATRDELTGLFNRRHGGELLRQALQRHGRSRAPLCVALLDIDHFKRVNDHHGHAVGDAVLRSFAQAAQGSLRSTDTLARWGGEEFLLLLGDSDAVAAERAMQRLRDAVAHAAIEVQGQRLDFRFSAGLTEARADDSAEAVLERADQALYRAKAEGRDRWLLG